MAAKQDRPTGDRIEIYWIKGRAPRKGGNWLVRRVAANGRKVWMSCQPQRVADAFKTAERWNRDLAAKLPVVVIGRAIVESPRA